MTPYESQMHSLKTEFDSKKISFDQWRAAQCALICQNVEVFEQHKKVQETDGRSKLRNASKTYE